MKIDAALSGPHRGLRTRPGSLLLGPTGRRLWADYLDDLPGFRGCLDYVHKLNVPMLFGVVPDVAVDVGRSRGRWRPSHLSTQQSFGELSLEEHRFVTWTDEAVSVQTWVNHGSRPVTLRAVFDEQWCSRDGDAVAGSRHIAAHGFTLQLRVRASDPRAWDGVVVAPGEEYRLQVVASLRHTSDEGADPRIDKGSTWDPADPGLLERQVAEYQRWFDDVPSLESSSPALDRVWAYRWYVLRSSLAVPEMGRLPGMTAYEGRSHKMTKDPWRPSGWEFTKLIPLSTPFHLLDLRWRTEARTGVEVMSSVPPVQGADGQLYSGTTTTTMKEYASFFGHAVAQFARVQGRTCVPEPVVETARRQVLGERAALGAGADDLPVQADHKRTGKEYQPSYWYFHDFPPDPKDPATFTPLKRVDRAVYQYLNATGVAELAARSGVADEEMTALAASTARSVMTKQWHATDGFFLDLHHRTDEPARVRNVVGFYPWWAGLTDERHLEGLRAALAPDAFGTPLPFPSVAVDCPAFRPQGGWMGHFLKGRNGCMWDGPAWPYTTGLVLDGVADAAQRHAQPDLAEAFSRALWPYVASHFRDGDLDVPYLVEHYDPLTGEPLSDEPDYSHSSLIDLLVRRVVGVQPRAEGWWLAPIGVGVDRLVVRELPVGQHVIEVALDDGGRSATLTCGDAVVYDGEIPEGGVALPWAEQPCRHAR